MFIRKYISTIKSGYLYRLCLVRLRNFTKKNFFTAATLFSVSVSQMAKYDGWQHEGTGLEDESLDAVEVDCLDSLDVCAELPLHSQDGATGSKC